MPDIPLSSSYNADFDKASFTKRIKRPHKSTVITGVSLTIG